MPKIKWLGDEDPHLQTVTEGGITFTKGVPVNVNKLHMYGGVNWFDKLKDNPKFSLDEDEEVPETDEDKEALKEELDKLGITYAKNASVETLRKKLADAQPDEDI